MVIYLILFLVLLQFEALQLLIAAKADVDKADDDNATPAYVAAQNGHPEAVVCVEVQTLEIGKVDIISLKCFPFQIAHSK